jgi:uncharacterized membrane protein SpoIIM required for sporulation
MSSKTEVAKIMSVSTPFSLGFACGLHEGASLGAPENLCEPFIHLFTKILFMNSLLTLKIILSSMLFWIPVPYYLFAIGYIYGSIISLGSLISDSIYIPAIFSYSIFEISGYLVASYVSLDLAISFYRFIRRDYISYLHTGYCRNFIIIIVSFTLILIGALIESALIGLRCSS